MALIAKKGCKACGIIAMEGNGDSTKSDLYKLVEGHLKGMLPVAAISERYASHDAYRGSGNTYNSIRNHTNKHQTLGKATTVKAQVALERKKIKKEMSQRYKHDGHVDTRTQLIEVTMDAIQSGEIKPTATLMGSLLEQERKIEDKQADRELEYAKLFNTYLANPLPAKREWLPDYEEGEIVEPPGE